MKLGCSSWSYHRPISEGRLDQREWLRICAEELELDGVELLDLHFPSLSRDYLSEIKRACAERQLTVSCVSVSNDFGVAGDEALERELARVKQWVNITSFLGAPVLRVFAGWVPRDKHGPHGGLLGKVRRRLGIGKDAKAERWPAVIRNLRECAAYAGDQGIVLGLENHNGRGLVGTADEVERCLDTIGSPWLQLNLDTGDYGDIDSIRRTASRSVHVHAKLYDLDDTGADPRFDWPEIVRILKNVHYRGYLSIEYEGAEDAITAVPRGVLELRRLLALA